jgi:hypothetical protein
MKVEVHYLCRGACTAIAVLALGVSMLQPALAQGAYAYPLKNQSAKQQQNDESECVRWATERTGFDPRRPPAYHGGYSSPPPSGSVNSGLFGRGGYGQGGGIADAGKGAGIGLIGGAIAGDAGKGAAIGALSGLFIGGIKRSSQAQEREAWQRQQAQQQNQQRAQYEAEIRQLQDEHTRAYGTCMSARGYRVG